MIKLCIHCTKLHSGWNLLLKRSSSNKPIVDTEDTIKRIFRIMMSSKTIILDAELDQSGIRVSPEIVDDVLKRFENAGMLAYRFFTWVEKQKHYAHSVKAYHSMIESLAKIRQFQIIWDLVNNMRTKGTLNIETFCIIMRKYARAQKVDEAVYTFNVMEKYSVVPNLTAFNGLLSSLCKSKNIRKAQEIFESMKDRFVPDSKTYSILLEGWGKEPNLPKAREIFKEMVELGVDPDVVTYGILVDILCKAGRVDEALGIVKEMIYKDIKPTSFIYSVLVHNYGVENRIEKAVDTFLEMQRDGVEADVAVYNALLGAFCSVNKMNNVYRVLKEMNMKGIQPNSRTCNIILKNLITRQETDEAFTVFSRMVKLCEPDADTYTMMIKMFCEKNDIEMAFKLWKFMKSKRFSPSMHTFSVLINGLCKMGNASKACVLLEEMIERGIRPSGVTFGRLRQLLIKEEREDVLEFLQEKMNLLIKEPLCD